MVDLQPHLPMLLALAIRAGNGAPVGQGQPFFAGRYPHCCILGFLYSSMHGRTAGGHEYTAVAKDLVMRQAGLSY